MTVTCGTNNIDAHGNKVAINRNVDDDGNTFVSIDARLYNQDGLKTLIEMLNQEIEGGRLVLMAGTE